jgi:TonB family protein
MMVKDLRHSKSRAINGNGAHRGYRAGDYGMFGELSKPLILSALVHVVALGGLFVFAPYFSVPRLSLPPAQMVQLVDLPSGGGDGGSKAARETPPPTPKQPEPPPEIPKAEKPPEPKPPEPKPPEPKPEKAEKALPPKPKEPPPEPEMALSAPKPKEPPKQEPPKREEKKPEPTPRAVVEKPPEKKKPSPSTPTPSAPAPRREATARAQPERSGPGSGGRPGPGSGPESGLALGGGSGMLSLDSANFPFTYYLRQVTGRIEENWIRPQQNLGRVVVYFRIKRDGTIIEPQIRESSRNQAVDLLASGAIKRSEPFPPLPVEFGGDYLGIYLCFGLGGACPGQKEG